MFSSPLTSLAFILAVIGTSTAAPAVNGSNFVRDVGSADDVCLTSKASVRCLPGRGLRNFEAGTAVNTLAYGRVPLEGFNIEAGTCIHYIEGYTCAQVCNYNFEDRVVSQKEVFLALDGLRMDCGADHFSGGRTVNNLTAYIYGIGGDHDANPSSVEENALTGEVKNTKRATVTGSKYENGILNIKVNEAPKSRAEVEALVNDMLLMHKRSEDSVNLFGAATSVRSINCDFKYKNNNRDCAAWCEVRRRYFYGLEKPYQTEVIRTSPGAGKTTLTVGKSVSWGASYGLSIGLADPLGLFSGGLGFSLEKSYSHSQDRTYEPDYRWLGKWCGYFTLIPEMVESCGSLTKWRSTTIVGPNGSTSPMCEGNKPSQTFGNQCITYPFNRVRDRVSGSTVVVKVDCKNYEVLAPMREQDALYRKPGVADLGPGMHRKAPGDKK
ncbi:hypothetical protein TWF730_002808 [Orbilia blumenaviensis]|uniref:Uncharacterized protein n=1 Tax=Orbilia blumenaviensis TaxID=1796055 RepID=A0AAV9U6Y9_9PEZI